MRAALVALMSFNYSRGVVLCTLFSVILPNPYILSPKVGISYKNTP